MFQTEIQESATATQLMVSRGLWYDAERLVLEGFYGDEVTAFRARKRWIEVLESNFLLERGIDFAVTVAERPASAAVMFGEGVPGEDGESLECRFSVKCDFLSACGRYAFWRITHHQAPQVQCLLESAHLARPLGFRTDTVPSIDEGWIYPHSEGASSALTAGDGVPARGRGFARLRGWARGVGSVMMAWLRRR